MKLKRSFKWVGLALGLIFFMLFTSCDPKLNPTANLNVINNAGTNYNITKIYISNSQPAFNGSDWLRGDPIPNQGFKTILNIPQGTYYLGFTLYNTTNSITYTVTTTDSYYFEGNRCYTFQIYSSSSYNFY